MIILLKDLKKKALNKPEGYYEDVISKGKIQGEAVDIPHDELQKLIIKYTPQSDPSDCQCCKEVR